MGVRILSGDEQACLYDSVTMTAFGPVFDDEEEADTFVDWLKEVHHVRDARLLTDEEMSRFYSLFCTGGRTEFKKKQEVESNDGEF